MEEIYEERGDEGRGVLKSRRREMIGRRSLVMGWSRSVTWVFGALVHE